MVAHEHWQARRLMGNGGRKQVWWLGIAMAWKRTKRRSEQARHGVLRCRGIVSRCFVHTYARTGAVAWCCMVLLHGVGAWCCRRGESQAWCKAYKELHISCFSYFLFLGLGIGTWYCQTALGSVRFGEVRRGEIREQGLGIRHGWCFGVSSFWFLMIGVMKGMNGWMDGLVLVLVLVFRYHRSGLGSFVLNYYLVFDPTVDARFQTLDVYI